MCNITCRNSTPDAAQNVPLQKFILCRNFALSTICFLRQCLRQGDPAVPQRRGDRDASEQKARSDPGSAGAVDEVGLIHQQSDGAPVLPLLDLRPSLDRIKLPQTGSAVWRPTLAPPSVAVISTHCPLGTFELMQFFALSS